MKNFLKNTWNSLKTLHWYEWLMVVVMIAIAAYSMIEAFIHPTPGSNPAWLASINFVSAVCGIMCIFLCAKANIYNFGFAIINTIVYIVYLAYWKIYGTMFLEILVYFPINFISLWHWMRHKDNIDKTLTKSKRLSLLQNVLVVLGITCLTVITNFFLTSLAGDSWAKFALSFGLNPAIMHWIDAATFSIGIVAVVLEMLRYREQYVWWIITDILAVGMYILHFDAVYLCKKSIYLIMAIVGLINWVKLNKERNVVNE